MNPYTPGAGVVPNYLAGRDELINKAEEILKSVNNGMYAKSLMFYGLRGVGKTVLLNVIQDKAEDLNIPYEHLEISENDNFKEVIGIILKKLLVELSYLDKVKESAFKVLGTLKAFSVSYLDIDFGIDIDALKGKADTGHFQNDLTELFLQIGSIAKKANKCLIIFIDEVQYLKTEDFEALIAALHRVSQKRLPLYIFGAGLPKIAKIAGDTKSYAERLFDYIKIDSLEEIDAEKALIEPAKEQGKTFSKEAINRVTSETEGYPYFIQEFGLDIWENSKENEITLENVESAYEKFIKKLDEGFFNVRYERATESEKAYLKAMGQLGKGPYDTPEVLRVLRKEASQVSAVRSSLIDKGLVYSPSHGRIAFTVPHFEKFLARIEKEHL